MISILEVRKYKQIKRKAIRPKVGETIVDRSGNALLRRAKQTAKEEQEDNNASTDLNKK